MWTGPVDAVASDDQRELEASLLEVLVGEPELKGISRVTLESSPDSSSISATMQLGSYLCACDLPSSLQSFSFPKHLC